jgi:hypothetical protein
LREWCVASDECARNAHLLCRRNPYLLLGETRLIIVVAGSRHSLQEDCMEGKAIQIVAYADHLYALCDDGAIFQQSQGAWFELEPIPHTEKTGLTEAEITERIKELASKHGLDAAKLLGGNVALPPKA